MPIDAYSSCLIITEVRYDVSPALLPISADAIISEPNTTKASAEKVTSLSPIVSFNFLCTKTF